MTFRTLGETVIVTESHIVQLQSAEQPRKKVRLLSDQACSLTTTVGV